MSPPAFEHIVRVLVVKINFLVKPKAKDSDVVDKLRIQLKQELKVTLDVDQDPSDEDMRATAFVVVNGPKSEFADIIVIVPESLLLLVQCKHYAKTTPLPSYKLLSEFVKMGMPCANQDTLLRGYVAGCIGFSEAKKKFPTSRRSRRARQAL